MPLSKPVFIKVNQDVMINLNQVASISAKRAESYKWRTLRADFPQGQVPTQADYITETRTADTISFFYADEKNSGLSFRVGIHITEEDYLHITNILNHLNYVIGEVNEGSTISAEAAPSVK